MLNFVPHSPGSHWQPALSLPGSLQVLTGQCHLTISSVTTHFTPPQADAGTVHCSSHPSSHPSSPLKGAWTRCQVSTTLERCRQPAAWAGPTPGGRSAEVAYSSGGQLSRKQVALAGHAGFCWEEADREELQAVGTLLGGPEEGERTEEPRGRRRDRTDRYMGLPGKEARED